MAKKKAARGGFNMSAEIRAMLEANPNLKGREILEELRQRHPEERINANSAHVAFSTARRKLGIAGKPTKAVRRRRPAAARRAATPVAATTVNLAHLKAARKFIAEVGSAQNAIAAVQQLEALQLG